MGDVVVELGCYVEIVFTDIALNERPENLLLLASHLLQAIEGCENWFGQVTVILEPLNGVAGTLGVHWCLLIRITNYGRNEPEARKFWGETLKRVGKAVSLLPTDFRS
jgi:hypothetical protein